MKPLKIECASGDGSFLLTGADEEGVCHVTTFCKGLSVGGTGIVELDRATMLEISHYWKDLLDREELQ